MSTFAIQVSNISPATTEQHLSEFFSFCGKIASIDYTPASQSATVHFEKPSAAKTALMLNGGALDGSPLTVTSETVHSDQEEEKQPAHHEGPLEQSDKPRAGSPSPLLL
ncbi:hypothetical protein AcV7_004847 [Taiwanofungus camphoratus]|nr:hypothetical protein AcV7_004847 [Antrodia cinnamomea]